MLDSSQALTAIQQNFGLLDTAGGSAKDGVFSKQDLQNVLQDQNISPELREAVNFLLNNPSAFNAADASAQANGTKPDGLISSADISKSLSEATGNTGPGQGADQMKSLMSQLESLQKQLDQVVGKDSGSQADGEMGADEAAKVLTKFFEQVDAADGRNDGLATLDGMKKVLKDQNVPQDLRDAINHFSNNPSEFKELETYRGPVSDNIFSLAELSDFAKKRATPPPSNATPPAGGSTPPAGGATPPTGGATPPSGGGTSSGGSISIGDIATMLGKICSQTENALKDKTNSLGSKTGADLTMEDQRKLQELGEIMKAFATLFANLIKAVSEAGDKSASKI